MPLPPLIEAVLPQALLLLALGLAGGWAAERLHAPRLVGGVLAGLLLGPTLMGQIAPEVHRSLFLGGSSEHQNLDVFEQRFQKDLATLRSTGISEVEVEAFIERGGDRRATLETALRAAEAPYRRAETLLIAMAIVGTLMALTYAAPMSGDPSPRWSAEGAAMIAWLTAGATGGLLSWLWLRSGQAGLESHEIAWLPGLILGCAAASVPFRARLLEGLSEPRIVQRSGMFLCILGVFLTYALSATRAVPPSPPNHPLLPGGAPGIGAISAMLVLLLAANLALRMGRRRLNPMTWTRRPDAVGAIAVLTFGFPCAGYLLLGGINGLAVGAVLTGALLQNVKTVEPSRATLTMGEALLFALIGSRLDLLEHFDWLLTLVVLIAFADAKALGMMLGARWLGRWSWREGLRMGVSLASAGGGALAVALLLETSGMIETKAYHALVVAITAAALIGEPGLRMLHETRREGTVEDTGRPSD